MTEKQRIAELRAEAAKYRAMARQSDDDETAHGIFALAAQIEQQARDIEQENHP
jgi:hypothetical protein